MGVCVVQDGIDSYVNSGSSMSISESSSYAFSNASSEVNRNDRCCIANLLKPALISKHWYLAMAMGMSCIALVLACTTLGIS